MKPELQSQFDAFMKEGVERGYKAFSDPFHRGTTGYVTSIQKRFDEGLDRLYFVEIDVWDMSPITQGKIPDRLSLEASAQFHTEDDMKGHHVNVKMPFQGFEATEAFMSRMYQTMGFGAYERHEPRTDPKDEPAL